MVDDGNKKNDVNLDEELASLDEFLNESDDDADAFPLDDENAFTEFEPEQKKSGGFAKYLGYTAGFALLIGAGFVAYTFIPQLSGTSALSDYEQNMNRRAAEISDPFATDQNQPSSMSTTNDNAVANDAPTIPAYNENPMPEASDANADEVDIIIVDDESSDAANDLSISEVDVTIVPEDEPLPDDVAALIGESAETMDGVNTVQIIDTNPETGMAVSIGEALEIVENAEAVESVEQKVDAEIQSAFDQDYPVEDMPTETVEMVDEEEMDSSFSRIPAAPMAQGFNTAEPATDTNVEIDVDEVQMAEEETILVTESSSDPVVDVGQDSLDSDDEITPNEELIVTEENAPEILPNVNEDSIDDVEVVEEDMATTGNDMSTMVEDTDTQDETIPLVQAETLEEVEKPTVDRVPNAPNMDDETDITVDMDEQSESDMVSTADVADTQTEAEEPTSAQRPAPAASPRPTPTPQPVAEKYSINSAEQLNQVADPRVIEGQQALAAGDFDAANRIFSAILASNPSNVHALTGKQMAVSRIAVPMPQMANSAPNPAPTQNNNDAAAIMNAPVPQTSVTSLPSTDTKIVAPADSVEALILQMNNNPRDAGAAVELADAYAARNNSAKATEWYQKALQLDALYDAGIDRMAVYDSLARLK